MHKLTGTVLTVVLLVTASIAAAQPERPRSEAVSKPATGDDLVAKMMVFDKNKDEKLTKDEVTDEQMLGLFDRSDANRDGTVTHEELASLAAGEPSVIRGDGPGGGPRGFMMRMLRPGELLSPLLQQRLQVTAAQKAQLTELQKDADDKLEQILTEDQKKQLKEIRDHGPGRLGPRGGGRPGGLGPRRGGLAGRGGPPTGSGQVGNMIISSSRLSRRPSIADYLDSLGNAIVDRSAGELVGAVMIALALSLAFAGLYFLGRRKAGDDLMPIIVLMIVANLASMAVAAGYLRHVKTSRGQSTVNRTQAAPASPDTMLVEFISRAADSNQDKLLSREEASLAAAELVRQADPSGKGLVDARSL